MIYLTQKSDIWGATASSLCIIHCLTTPLLFVTQTSSISYFETLPFWWKYIDYFFLVISFMAVYKSTITTSLNWIKKALWINWTLLFIVIVNEKLKLFILAEVFNFIPASALIIIHLYNQKYCTCNTNKCCQNER